MPGLENRLKSLVLGLIDRVSLGVPLRNLYHDLKYSLDFAFVARNRRYRASVRGRPGSEGLPYPPPGLIYRVGAHFDQEQFEKSGRLGADNIRRILRENGSPLTGFASVLDFGCGCGRVMRQWVEESGPRFFGSDYQRALVRWCRRHLEFASFGRNGLASPLDFPDGTFDFVYAISVFTHLDRSAQFFWMGELARVLKPRGRLLITVHGTTRRNELSPEEQADFEAGKPIVHQAKYSGSNVCATYHPRSYVQDVLGKGLRLLDFRPGGAPDANQDAFLFEKP